jgi:outer membrane protein TolC
MRVKNAKQLIFLAFFILPVGAGAQRLLTLEQTVEQALKTSPTIEQSRLTLKKSEETLKAQRASLKSSFSLDVDPFSYSRQKKYYSYTSTWYTEETYSSSGDFSISQPILWTDGVISMNNNLSFYDNTSSASSEGFKGFSNSLTLALEQPLFTYNATKQELQELELDYEDAALSYALAELDVESDVTEAFYNVYEYQMTLNVSKEELENNRASYTIIKNKVEGGLVAKEELYQAELDLLSSESTVLSNEVTFENYKDYFKQLVGIDLEEDIMVIADVSVFPVDIDLSKAVEQGIKNRMEIRQREIEIQEGLFDLITTNASSEFEGELSVEVGLFGENENMHNVYNDPTSSQSISLGLTIPIWDWGKKKAKLKAAEATVEMSRLDLRDEEIDIKLNIRQVYRNLQNYLKQIEIARKNIENAELTYDINLEKYRNGDLTSMDLNLVQEQLTDAKNDLTSAIIDYKLELLNMKIQSMYDFEKNTSVVPNLNPEK